MVTVVHCEKHHELKAISSPTQLELKISKRKRKRGKKEREPHFKVRQRQNNDKEGKKIDATFSSI